MKMMAIGPDGPGMIEEFGIEWSSLVTKTTRIENSSHEYLRQILAFTNDSLPRGLFALEIELTPSAGLDRLLARLHVALGLRLGFVAAFFSRTALAAAVSDFASPEDLATRVSDARFEWLSPLLLEGTMADDLYYYGMYDFFCGTRSADDARSITRDFLGATLGDTNLEEFVPLTTRLPWGEWFDPHSCSDRTWLLLRRGAPRAWLLVLSHSD